MSLIKNRGERYADREGGMFQERCERTYFFMFNTQIKYIYIERMKTKMP